MPSTSILSGVQDLPKIFFAEGASFRMTINMDADFPLTGKFAEFGIRSTIGGTSGSTRRTFRTDSDESNLSISSQVVSITIDPADETVPAFTGGWTLSDVQDFGDTEYWIDFADDEGDSPLLRLQGRVRWVEPGEAIPDGEDVVSAPEFDVTITSGAVAVTVAVTGGEVGIPVGGSTGQVLRKASGTAYDAEWATVSGTGDVVGPASSTDNAISRFDATSGKAIQNSGITIADGESGTLAGTNSGDVTLAGSPNYLTLAGQVITRALVNLTSHITGTLPIANGGTGQTALASVDAADLGSGAATDNYVLTADGLGGVAWEAAAGGGAGTVTSVAVSGSDGIEIDSGSPITSSGTIALGINAATLKTHISISNVENTALSTWAGSTAITTIGTIATGTVPLANVSGKGDAAAKNTGTSAGTVAAGDHTHAQLHDAVTLSGTPDYITLTGQVLTRGQIDLTTDVTGVLPIANFATGTPTGSKFLRDDASWQAIAGGGDALTGNPLSQFAATTSAQLAGVISDETGTGVLVFATSPTLVTPLLGTPTSGTLTNCTGLPVSSGISGLGTGIGTFLTTPSSANLLAALTDETGTGSAVFATSPTLVTPLLGTPTSGTLTNCTGLPTAGLVDDAVTLAKMAAGTAGNLITYDASGNPAAVATGTSGHVLTSNGTGAAPTFQVAAGGGGKTYLYLAADFSTTSTSFVDVDNGGGDSLIFAMAANTAYGIQFISRATTNATTDGLEIGINGPTSPTLVIGEIIVNLNVAAGPYRHIITSYDADIVSTTGPGAGTMLGASAHFIVVNGSTAGDCALRFRSEVGGTSTIKAGSVLIIETLTAG